MPDNHLPSTDKRIRHHSLVAREKMSEAAKNRHKPFEERFWERIEKNGLTQEHCKQLGPCWIWQGKLNHSGYGVLYKSLPEIGSKGRTVYAHRISWEISYGPIPQDICVLHHCDNPSCCNPSHLFLGTKKDNVVDCLLKGRRVDQINSHMP